MLSIFQYFFLPLRLIKRQICRLLKFADFQSAARPLIQQFHQFAVDLIDAVSPVLEIHGAASRLESPWRAASFKIRIRSRRAFAACCGVFACSISATKEDPTTAASASPPSKVTCPGSEIPKPTAMGSVVKFRARRNNAGKSSGKVSFAPVTPVRETRYRKPLEHSAMLASRSSVEVGAQRKIVSR